MNDLSQESVPVHIHRRLAAANPAAHEPALATSLNNLSIRLADAGRRAESEGAIREASELRTQGAK